MDSWRLHTIELAEGIAKRGRIASTTYISGFHSTILSGIKGSGRRLRRLDKVNVARQLAATSGCFVRHVGQWIGRCLHRK